MPEFDINLLSKFPFLGIFTQKGQYLKGPLTLLFLIETVWLGASHIQNQIKKEKKMKNFDLITPSNESLNWLLEK